MSRWARVALAVGGAFFLAETRASASCGDHPVFSFTSFGQYAPPTDVRDDQRSTPPSAVGQEQPLPCNQCPVNPFEAPCRGPSCSNNNLPDGMPITSGTVNVAQDQWNLTWMQPRLNLDEQIDWLSLGQMLFPIARTNSIFHPPRCS